MNQFIEITVTILIKAPDGKDVATNVFRIIKVDHIHSIGKMKNGKALVIMEDYDFPENKPPKKIILRIPTLQDYAELRKQLTGKSILEPELFEIKDAPN